MTPVSPEIAQQFLQGEGEMNRLTREYNWNETLLGEPTEWPQNLRITLGLVLDSAFPMFLFWGEEHLCFYNDAFRPSLGNNGKHPAIGKRGKEVWHEIWELIGPLIDSVMTTGKPLWYENLLVPFFRNGKIEDIFWTFSYSAVRNESGQIEGVLVVCNETTSLIETLTKLENSENKFRNLIRESPIATALFSGPEFYIDIANDEALQLWGKGKIIIGKKVAEALPELKGQPYLKILEEVFATGETYYGNENLVFLEKEGSVKPIYVNFIYKALRDEHGETWGILTMGFDVTEQVLFSKKIQDSEERSRLAIDAAMLGTFDIDISTFTLVCSQRFCEIFGFDRTDITYEDTIRIIHPDDLHIREEANKQAIQKGGVNYEIRLLWPDRSVHWVNVRGKLFLDADKKPVRILGIVMDITKQKNFLDSYIRAETRFRNTVKQAPVGISIFIGPEFIVEMANDDYLRIVDKTEADFVGKPLFHSLPEIKDSVEAILTGVLMTGKSFNGTEFPVTLNRYGKKEITYFNFAYQPYMEENNKVSGVIVIANEVTESVKAKQLLAESEKQFRNLIAQSPIPMAIFRGKEFIIELANKVMFEKIWRKKESDLIGKKAFDIFPELIDQKYPALLNKVMESGKAYKENESVAYVQGDDGMKKFYLDYEYGPLFDMEGGTSGIMITVNDVTEKVEARQRVEVAEKRLRLAVEATELATWDLDLQTNTIIFSKRLAEIFGHDEKTFNYEKMSSQIHPDDVQAVVDKAFDEAVLTGVYSYEARIIRPNQSIRWIKTKGTVIYDEERNPIKLIGTLQDISAQKTYSLELQNDILERTHQLELMNSELKQSEERYHQMVDEVQDYAILYLNKNGIIENWNKGAEKIKGYKAQEIIGKNFSIFYTEKDRQSALPSRLLNEAIVSGRATHEGWRVRKDGSLFWGFVVLTALHDEQKNIIGFSKVTRDLTEKKKAEDEIQMNATQLEEKNKTLQKMNAELESFAYVSSHDLQEPLRKIQTFASLILEKENNTLSDNGKDYFKRMQLAARRMQMLIDDLLSYSRASSGVSTFIETDLNEILVDVKKELKEVIDQKKATIESNIDCRASIIPFQFRQLLMNLIANSMKFQNSDVSPIIKIKCSEIPSHGFRFKHIDFHKTCYHFSISDNGIGFDSNYSNKIFEVFQRLHGKDQYEGTGIGLAIVKKIVENHNGFITASGDPGKGSTFDIYFPKNN